MSRKRRSNRRFGPASAHVASSCCISLIIKGLHLIWSGNLHSKQIELFPFAMWQAFPAADYYGNSASMMDIRVNSLATQNIVGIPSCLPSFICWTLHALGRLPVAVLVLASRKSMPMSWSGCVLPMTPCETPYIYARIRTPPAYVLGAPSAFRLLSRVGEGDISALGCGLTGSCSSTFQCYSLGNHLGVTASPQFPLPAGYVTLPVDDRSPPLGLMPLTAGGTAFFKSSFLNAFQSYAPRTIRDEAHRR